ncbi:MAG TPA: septum formation initiator family protein [Desulfobulbaceae bacterium]|nr:septum formation initiator family protein [Desulfobulbaceae bacterium]
MTRQRKSTLSLQERKRLRRIIILVALTAVLLLLFFPGRSLMSYYRMQKQVSMLSRQNALLEQRNRELAAEIKRLQTDDNYLEELARKKYGLLKDNETVYEFKSGRKRNK